MVQDAVAEALRQCAVMYQTAVRRLWGTATRRKRTSDEPSQLARVLSVLDLTLLGAGSTLGLGVYVLAGKVANDSAGPGVLLSFIIAAVASLFAALCYAEFAARVPKAGSAYVYAYVAVGEIVAFVIGWTLILEYAIGTASVTRGVSSYVDNLVDHKMSQFFNDSMPLNVPTLAAYPDFFSFVVILVVTGLLSFGVKESTVVNNVFTFLNLGTAAVAVVTAGIYANADNWRLPARPGKGSGGFLPYGMKGVIEGAGTCFYGFIGFDCIATTSEEAKNPRRSIPMAILLSLCIICLTYCSIAVALTLVKPYYELDKEAPFTVVFEDLGLGAVKWIVTLGAICALTTSLLGSLIPLPRVMYAMALDGMIFTVLARVNSFTKTPLVATLVAGLLSGFLALIFNLEQLIEMMSIGTLLSYTVVGVCVVILRYTDSRPSAPEKPAVLTFSRSLGALVNWERSRRPTLLSTGAVGVLILVQILLSLGLSVVLKTAGNELYEDPRPWAGPTLAIFVPLVVVVAMLGQQPQADVGHLSFRVPLVPWVPSISLFLNLYLMVNLDVGTWIRFVVWMAIGAALYFSYGVRHSTERLLRIAEGRSAAGDGAPAVPAEVRTHL